MMKKLIPLILIIFVCHLYPVKPAFSAPSSISTDVAYDSVSNRFMVTYPLGSDIFSRLVHYNGATILQSYINVIIPAYEPRIVHNSFNQQFEVVWTHNIPDGYGGTIGFVYGHSVDSLGNWIGGNYTISTANGSQNNPAIYYHESNQQFLVVWDDERSMNSDIYGQFLSSTGQLINSNFTIASGETNQSNPAIAYDTDNQRFLIVWQELRGSWPQIYGQFLTSHGDFIGLNVQIASLDGSYFTHPSIAYDGSLQRFLIVWRDSLHTTSYRITGKFYSGDAMSGAVPISFSAVYEAFPQIAYDPINQQFVVVWEERPNSSQIYGRLIYANGSMANSFTVSTEGLYERPSIAFNSRCENFLIAYYNRDGSAVSQSIYPPGQFKAKMAASPTSYDFGAVTIGTASPPMTFTVENAGCVGLAITSVSKDHIESPFVIQNNNCPVGQPIEILRNCSFQITFSPANTGYSEETIQIRASTSAGGSLSKTITVSGSGSEIDTDAGIDGSEADGSQTDADQEDTESDAIEPQDTGEADGSSGNNGPTKPILVYPTDGQTGLPTKVEFRWKKATDPDGDLISYYLHYCTNSSFVGCEPEFIPPIEDARVIRTSSGVNFAAGLGGFVFIGLLLIGFVRGRRRIGLVLFVFIVTSVMALAQCKVEEKKWSYSEDEVGYTVSNLQPNTKYFWKVVARDTKEAESSSDIWSFTTGE